jgi:DNA-binding NtrC family response regulator
VDDDSTLRASCSAVLEGEGYDLTLCGRADEALDLLRREPFDIVILDWYMTGVPGTEILRATLAAAPRVLVIVITGMPSLESNLDALQQGAWDYLPKPFSAMQLRILIGRAAHTVQVSRESNAERRRLQREGGHSDKVVILGQSTELRSAVDLARRVSQTDASVFLTGESGVGKELFAQFIHQHSGRSSRPFVALNCAAIPDGLLESEMFGHCRGAFTGAIRDKPGLLETAHGGTLLLDELGEMPLPLQAKLLRVIQDGVVRRVGSESATSVVNVRFIAATNRDPEAAVTEGALRRDLYYRLRVVPIRVPALRERHTDIPLLAKYFLSHYWDRHRQQGLAAPRFSDEALAALAEHEWLGNVRELQNLVEHMVVLAEPGGEITASDIPFIQDPGGTVAPPLLDGATIADGEKYYEARDQLLATFDRRYLARVVSRSGGNLSKAARMAGIDRTTFYRLMQRHGLRRGLLSDGTT